MLSQDRRLRPSLLKALLFISTHPGTRHRAMFDYQYRFTEPKLKRAPFRLDTVNELVGLGLVEALPVKDKDYELVQVSELGKKYLPHPNAIYPVDKRGRRKRLAKNWC